MNFLTIIGGLIVIGFIALGIYFIMTNVRLKGGNDKDSN